MYLINAEEARKLSKRNEPRKRLVESMVNDACEYIKLACEKGRNWTYVPYMHKNIEIKEVINYLKNSGFDVKKEDNKRLLMVKW